MSRGLPATARGLIAAAEKIEQGTLRLITPEQDVLVFGNGNPAAELEIHDWRAVAALAARGDIGLGETYCEGAWDSPDIEALTRLALLNEHAFDSQINGTIFNRFVFVVADRFLRRNSRKRSRENIRSHYDVGNPFYELWLDPTMTYSSALFGSKDEDLESAQKRKYDRILDSIKSAGERTLEIGCGWGGFAERAADRGHRVTGISISPAQVTYAMSRLGNRADILLQDYRDTTGKFDSIVSIEMIEAVGEHYWPQYFNTLKNRLASAGNIVIQAIVVKDAKFSEYRKRSDYIRHYIFPGGMLPCPSGITAHAERAGLRVEEIKYFGLDYERTLRQWLANFISADNRIRALGYSDAFQRSWKFYLSICAASFAVKRTNVAHFKLTHA